MTPDQAAQLRKEVETLEDTRKKALAGLSETLAKIETERRSLESLRVDREEFIAKRVIEAELQAKTAHSKAQEATEQIVSMETVAIGMVERSGEAVQRAIAWISGLVQSAGEIADSAQTTKDRLEAGMKKLEESYKKLESMIIENSGIEKTLKKREKEVEEINKSATAKLQEAERLAYWHDKPGAVLTK